MNALKSERRWCVWKKEMRNGSFTKVPYIEQNIRGKSNDPDTWINYQNATNLKENDDSVSGLGFFLSCRENDPEYCLCVIDVDAHNGENGENPHAAEVLNAFAGTYAEKSPSGTGYHIVCNVRLDAIPLDCNNKLDFLMKNSEEELEIYIGNYTYRFMTYTEDQVSEADVITDQTDAVLAFIDQYMKKPLRQRSEPVINQIRNQQENNEPIPTPDVSILERLELARRSKYGKNFIDLYDQGDKRAYDNDDSRADWALVTMLCFWLGPYDTLIDTAYRASCLYRDKWDEPRGAGTYGSMTIQNAIQNCRSFYIPPVQENRPRESWIDHLRANGPNPTGETVTFDQTIDNTLIAPDDVLHMINEIEDDMVNRDRITVLPLMCGTGKSTAIRLKMRQIIEANDGEGMIVVTDNLDRMRDYLLPGDDEMRLFFLDYQHLITVMTNETLVEDVQNEPNCPILIMSTQRYINLSRDQIRRYLVWNGGYRSLIIIDEQPYFKRQVDISIDSLNRIYSAITLGIPENARTHTEKEELKDNWVVIRQYLEECLNNVAASYNETGQYYRFQFINWEDTERFDRVLKLFEKHRYSLNNYLYEEPEDIFSLAQAVHQILTKGALFQLRVMNGGRKTYKYSVLLDYYNKYTDLDAKVIILDGTADVSTAYQFYDLDIRNCDIYKRSLEKLNIRIVDMPTGKTALQTNHQLCTDVIGKVSDYLLEHVPENQHPVVFSYKFLNTILSRRYGENKTSWFGRIRGSNDFRDAQYVAQIGINRFPAPSYFLFELSMNPELLVQLHRMDYEEHTEFIKNRINDPDGFTHESMEREILAELEQNIFRGTIRNSNTNEPYTFFLFTPLRHRDLIRCIHARYEPLNAHIEEEAAPVTEAIMGFMERSYNDGRRTNAQLIVDWHDKQISVGTVYKYQDVIDGTGLTLNAIKKARETARNQVLNKLFTSERQPGREATFKKQENWYWQDEEND